MITSLLRQGASLGHGGSRLAVTTSAASVLTTDTEVPVVTKTTVEADLLHALDVVAESSVDIGGDVVKVVTALTVLAAVEHPDGDVVLEGHLDASLDLFELVLSEITSAKEGEWVI